jgi:DNA ligase-1
MKNLEKLQTFVNEMKNTSSLLKKKEILKKYKNDVFITSVLNYTYNPYKQFHVTSKTLKKNIGLGTVELVADKLTVANIFDLLDALSGRVVTGHDAIRLVNSFVVTYANYAGLIYSVIDKNLEIRASESVINKVIPGLVPSFNVALASNYEPKLVDFENETWYASRKLDGVRCVIIVDENGKANAYSRQGKQFETLDVVTTEIEIVAGKLGMINLVFDGELCLVDECDNEDFQGVMKQIRKKDHIIKNPRYKVFDVLPKHEFESKKGKDTLSQRLDSLKDLLDKCDTPVLSALPQYVVKDDNHFAELNAEAEKKGYEGLMLRKDVGYQGKRTKNLLKVKSFFDEEFKVLGLDFKEHRIIREGKEVVRPMLAQVFIEHKGYKVSVGSGFSQEQRIYYYENPDELVGKTITVQYFEETQNQQGGLSLRFPTVKHVYENGRNV